MTISFQNVPANTRIPFVAIEIDPSQAQQGPGVQPYKVLIIGNKKTTGTTVAQLVPTRATSADQVADYFGRGSVIHNMAQAYFANNQSTETWFVGVNDDGGATAASEDVVITGTATEAGTIAFYVAGRRVTVGVSSGDTATEVGDALAAAINADLDMPATASATTGTVTITARNLGGHGNDIDLRINYYDGERAPDGLAVAGLTMSGGAGILDISGVWAKLGDEHFTHIVLPFQDTAGLAAIEAELADRYGPMNPVDAHAFTAYNASYANTAAIGAARNSPHVTMLGTNQSPTPPWEAAAALAGVAAFHLNIDPARPLQTLQLKGVLAPERDKRWTETERNLLLFDGISTFYVDAGGLCRIERIISQYQTNAFGADDTAFLDLNSLATLSYLRWDLRTRWRQRYPRHKLRSDADVLPPGQAIMTPSIARAELIAIYEQWVDLGLVENTAEFSAGLIVEINAQDPNRLDVFMTPDLVNQLRLTAMLAAFRL